MISLSKCATKFFHYNRLFPETPVRKSSKKGKKALLKTITKNDENKAPNFVWRNVHYLKPNLMVKIFFYNLQADTKNKGYQEIMFFD